MLCTLFQLLARLSRNRRTQIGQDHCFFQFVKQIVVHLDKRRNDVLKLLRDRFGRFLQSLLNFVKESHSNSFMPYEELQ